MSVEWRRISGTLLFFIAGVSDWLDGYCRASAGRSPSSGAFSTPSPTSCGGDGADAAG